MRFRYWIRTGLQTFGMVIGACAIYSLLMIIQMDDLMFGVLILMPLYLLLFGGMMLLAMNIGVYKMNLPLALSFGSTRNEAILGLNLFRLIPAVLMTAVLAVLCGLSPEEAMLTAGQAIPVGLGVYLACGALGTVIGVIFTRYGKLAAILTAIFLLLAGGACGFVVGFSDTNSVVTDFLFSGSLPWLVLSIGILIYALASIPEQRTVWKCNVKL